MTEKKIVVDGLRLSYNGPFDIIDFYKFVENWLRKNSLHKETKRKLEHVTTKGKKIEWMIECWKDLEKESKSVTRMRAIFNNVTEIELVKGDSKRKLNHGNVLIIIDGFVESHYHRMWYSYKPLWFFSRALFDKFIWKIWTEKHDETVRKISYDLHKVLNKFFDMYKH